MLSVKNLQDAVIVGGGPAGSCTAWELAKRGLIVSVLEEHALVGAPSHCAGHLSIRSLKKLGLYPLPEGIVDNLFSGANFYSPKGTKFSVHLNKAVTCAVDRELFDRYLMQKAEGAGAQYRLSSKVHSLSMKDGFVNGVILSQNDKAGEEVSAKIIVDAEGISSRLIKQTGISGFNPQKLVYAVEAEVDGVTDVEEHSVEIYLGSQYAPGFYAWLIPKLDGTAKIGLAVKKGNPKEHLQRLMQRHPGASRHLRTAKITRMSFHAVTLGGPIARPYSNGFLAVGDCASQVKPTTGGGVVFSVTCAKIAAEVAAEAITRNDFSSSFLQIYQKRCVDVLGFDVRVMLKAREFLDRLSDENLNRALQFALKVDLDKSLRDIEEIDFQGRTFLTLLKKPATYAALAYFAKLYLSANA